MKRKDPPRPKFDHTIWVATFTGYKVIAFGREQILYAPLRFEIQQEIGHPGVWIARVRPGANDAVAWAENPEICMRYVEGLFVTQLEPWQAWSGLSLFGNRKLTPTLIVSKGKKVS